MYGTYFVYHVANNVPEKMDSYDYVKVTITLPSTTRTVYHPIDPNYIPYVDMTGYSNGQTVRLADMTALASAKFAMITSVTGVKAFVAVTDTTNEIYFTPINESNSGDATWSGYINTFCFINKTNNKFGIVYRIAQGLPNAFPQSNGTFTWNLTKSGNSYTGA